MLYYQFPVSIENERCSKCRICENICKCILYDKEENIIKINSISCKGCGICLATCPSNAILHPYDDHIYYVALEDREPEAFECSICRHEYIEDGEKIVFCERRFSMGKAIKGIAEGRKIIVKKCLFLDDGEVENDKIMKLKKILELFGLDKVG